MNFALIKIILWLKNGKTRTVEFKENKINIITGDSQTGKSSILDIIDYCLCSSKVNIPKEVINDNVEWYGINFIINNKKYTICRQRYEDSGKPSNKYHFSGDGVIPKKPDINMQEVTLKNILSQDFFIKDKVNINYGGKKLQKNSKISFRYFLLFNTQSQDVITQSNVYFDYDKHDSVKYREALDRIFDLATNIIDLKNLIINDEITKINEKINEINKDIKTIDDGKKRFNDEISKIIKKAKQYNLIDDSIEDSNTDISNVYKLLDDFSDLSNNTKPNKKSDYERERRALIIRIKNLKSLKNEISLYKKNINRQNDSIKPIEFLLNNSEKIISNNFIGGFLEDLKRQLRDVKKENKGLTPFGLNINSEIKKLETDLSALNIEINKLPNEHISLVNREKYVFIGEVKKILEIFHNKENDNDYEEEIKQLEKKIASLEKEQWDIEENRMEIINMLNEFIDLFLSKSSSAMGAYSKHKASFNYKDKTLKLRKTAEHPQGEITGSGSTHLFMHICLFLGLHELFISEETKYVPRFLILDQFSQPYYDGIKKTYKESDDRKKVRQVLDLLNYFIEHINNTYNKHFQMIVFEHIPKESWNNDDHPYIHLVEEFRNGKNSLIPPEMLT